MSANPSGVPEDVLQAARLARRLAALPERTPQETAQLNQARFKVACYACRREKVPLVWENISYILGAHADEIRPAFERAIAQRREAGEEAPAPWMGGEDGDDFWQSARRKSHSSRIIRKPGASGAGSPPAR